MRILASRRVTGLVTGLVTVFAVGAFFACQPIDTGSDASAAAAAAASDAALDTAAAVVGGGCGSEENTGAQLCVATSLCPNVVVDVQSTPHCGFRIRGAAVDLVCACGTAICPMGVFTTCEEATKLLATQTEQGVCVQIAEERCVDSASAATPTPATTTAPATGGPNPACDRQCVKDCGGGEACFTVCNCG